MNLFFQMERMGSFVKGQPQGKYSKYGFLLDDDVAIMQDKHGGIMHNKIAIINGKAFNSLSSSLGEGTKKRGKCSWNLNLCKSFA